MSVSNELLQQRLQAAFAGDAIEVGGDGYHFSARVVSAQFACKRPVARQQLVYAALNDWIASGELHALSMQCFTPEEWQTQSASAAPNREV